MKQELPEPEKTPAPIGIGMGPPPLCGIPIYINPLWNGPPKYLTGVGFGYSPGAIIAKDTKSIEDLVEWANRVWKGWQDLGDSCVRELLTRYAEWQKKGKP